MNGKPMSQNQPVVYRLLFACMAIAAFLALAFAVQHTVSCLLLSFVLAYLLDPFVTSVEQRGIRRIYGILLLYSLLGLLAYVCLAYLFPLLSLRWAALIHDIPLYFQKVKQIAMDLKNRFGPSIIAEEWRWLVDSIQSSLERVLASLGAGIYKAAFSMVFNLFNLLLSPVLVFFMLFYKHEATSSIARWLPASNRDFLLAIGRDINRSIGGFIRGQVIVSTIVAVLSTVALVIFGVNHPVFCGIFAGLASVIPFIGVLLATLPPLFFAYAEYQSGVILLEVVAAFSIIYFLEGYVIKPLVFKESMDLNPLVTIIMVMAMGEFLGFWGILLAIPCAGAIKIFFNHLRRDIQ